MQPRYLKAHLKRAGHQWERQRAHKTAKKDVVRDRRVAEQMQRDKVCWGDKQVANVWQFVYLGSVFQADGAHGPDVQRRIGRAMARAGKLRHVWASDALTLKLKLRLYVAAVCSIMTYGSETWLLDVPTCRALNGANATMLARITGKSQHDEAKKATTTFDIVRNIRARRLQWLGHILRMEDHRLVKKAVYHIYMHQQEGDLCMDAPVTDTWSELLDMAKDRDTWRYRVKVLRTSPCKRWQKMMRKMNRKIEIRLD